MYRTAFKSFIFITFVIVYQLCHAQNIIVKNLQTQRLLPSANLHHIVKDQEGYMWYATEDGLCRDNGYQVDVFRSDYDCPDFWPSNDIVDLAVGKDRKIWAATRAGLYYLDKADYQLRQVTDDRIPHRRINYIDVTSDGTVWVVGGKRIVRLTAEGTVKKVYQLNNPGDGKKFVTSIQEDSQGRYWIFECRGGIRRYDVGSDSFVPCRWDCPYEPHGGFYEDVAHGCFWVSTWGMGVVKYVLGARDDAHRVEYQPCTYEGRTLDESKGKIIAMECDGRTLWCSAMDGFYAYDIQEDGTLQPHPTESLVPQGKKVFAAIYVDAGKNVWVASYSPRTFILCRQGDGGRRFTFPSMETQTGMEMIAEHVVEDVDGWVWMWHLRFGLVVWNPQTDESHVVLETQRELEASKVMSGRRAGGVWMAAGTTVRAMEWEDGKVYGKEVIDVKQEVRCLLDDGKGHLWIGTSDAIFCYDMKNAKAVNRAKAIGNVDKMELSDDARKLYFVSPQYGLGVVDVARGGVRKLSAGLEGGFTTLAVSSQGKVWTASGQGGVFCYDVVTDSLERDADVSLLDGGAVMDLATDRLGHVWVMASKCLKEYSPRWKTCRMFYAEDGGIDLDYFLCMGNLKGQVCVGGAGGLCLLTPTVELDRHSVVRKPLFSSVTVDGKEHLFGQEETDWIITPGDVSVAVNFSTLDHLNADRIGYAYCLHRRGEEAAGWTYLPIGQNTAYFGALEKGDYVLEVKATDAYGNWGEEVACLPIVREPAWWETWWMYALYVLSGATVLACIFYFYFRNKMQRMEIEKLVALAQKMRGQREGPAREATTAEGIELSPDEGARTERDERTLSKEERSFLLKAKEKVEKNLGNPNYTTEQFASDMCMSRMSLYRKLQHTTGQAPTEFIRMVRLKEAARLLRAEGYTVTEAARRTGFATSSYFTKCFKEAFGVLPAEYRKKQKNGRGTVNSQNIAPDAAVPSE